MVLKRGFDFIASMTGTFDIADVINKSRLVDFLISSGTNVTYSRVGWKYCLQGFLYRKWGMMIQLTMKAVL